jgi:hypothetical protein
MSELGHCVVFWFAGLLAGVLLGWILGRRAVGAAKGLARKPSTAVSLVVRDAPRLQPCRERQSA